MFEESTHIRSTHLAPSGAHSGMISASTMVGAAAPSCMISMRTLYGADMITQRTGRENRARRRERRGPMKITRPSEYARSRKYCSARADVRAEEVGSVAPVSRVAVSSVVLVRARL